MSEQRPTSGCFASEGTDESGAELENVDDNVTAFAKENVALRTTNAALRRELHQFGAKLAECRANLQDAEEYAEHLQAELANKTRTVQSLQSMLKTSNEVELALRARLRGWESGSAKQKLQLRISEQKTARELASSAKLAPALRQEVEDLRQQQLALKDQLLAWPRALMADIPALLDVCAQLSARCATESCRRRVMHNALMEIKGNIRVYCRLRPGVSSVKYGSEGKGDTGSSFVRVDDRLNVVAGDKVFQFDHVHDQTATQATVFAEVEMLIQSVVDGYSACVLAYGQTGSGKVNDPTKAFVS